jgi:hypothetical protein
LWRLGHELDARSPLWTASESASRASLYILSVSSALVALGFIGQASQIGTTFDVFALTVLPTLYVLGVFTFVRVVECGAEDFRYGVAVSRIRNYYKQIAGDQAKLFVLSIMRVHAHSRVSAIPRRGLSRRRSRVRVRRSRASPRADGIDEHRLTAAASGYAARVELLLDHGVSECSRGQSLDHASAVLAQVQIGAPCSSLSIATPLSIRAESTQPRKSPRSVSGWW